MKKHTPKQSSADELGKLIELMCATKDPTEVQKLNDQIMEGWYGETPAQIRARARKMLKDHPDAWWLGDPDKFTNEQIHSLLDGATEVFR